MTLDAMMAVQTLDQYDAKVIPESHPAVRPCEPPSAASNVPGAKHLALFSRRCPNARFKHGTILRREPDFCSFGYHPNVESRICVP